MLSKSTGNFCGLFYPKRGTAVKQKRITRMHYVLLAAISWYPSCLCMSFFSKKFFAQWHEEIRRQQQENLVHAAHGGPRSDVSQLIKDTGVNFIALDTTPLCQAAQQGRLKVVKLLLAHNADPNYARPDGVTPLIVASEHGHTIVVKCLLKNNANPNQSDRIFRTPLLQASDEHEAIVRALLQAKASPNQPDGQGVTPYRRAFHADQKSIVVLLLEAGALVPGQQTVTVKDVYASLKVPEEEKK